MSSQTFPSQDSDMDDLASDDASLRALVLHEPHSKSFYGAFLPDNHISGLKKFWERNYDRSLDILVSNHDDPNTPNRRRIIPIYHLEDDPFTNFANTGKPHVFIPQDQEDSPMQQSAPTVDRSMMTPLTSPRCTPGSTSVASSAQSSTFSLPLRTAAHNSTAQRDNNESSTFSLPFRTPATRFGHPKIDSTDSGPQISFSLMRHPVDDNTILINHAQDALQVRSAFGDNPPLETARKGQCLVLEAGDYYITLPFGSIRLVLVESPGIGFEWSPQSTRQLPYSLQRSGIDFQSLNFVAAPVREETRSPADIHLDPRNAQITEMPYTLRIPQYSLSHIGTIYSGTSCTVNAVRHSGFPGETVASYTPLMVSGEPQDIIEEGKIFLNRVRALDALQHPSIIRKLGSDSRTLTIYLEFAPKETLGCFGSAVHGQSMSELGQEDMLYILANIGGALSHMHGLGWTHGGIDLGAIAYQQTPPRVKLLGFRRACHHVGGAPSDAKALDVYKLGVVARYVIGNLNVAQATALLEGDGREVASWLPSRNHALHVWSRPTVELLLRMTSSSLAERPAAADVSQDAQTI